MFFVVVFLNVINHPVIGRKGGFAFAWKDGMDFESPVINPHVFNLLIYSDLGHIPLLTIVDGPTTWREKNSFL